MSESSNISEVTIVLNEESFTISAPMFDHTFLYGDVNSIELDNNFDKGSRISGYGTNVIHSGHFRNSTLGDYELASYTEVTPCVVIFVGGNAYAFNQSSDTSTQELYEELSSKINT